MCQCMSGQCSSGTLRGVGWGGVVLWWSACPCESTPFVGVLPLLS